MVSGSPGGSSRYRSLLRLALAHPADAVFIPGSLSTLSKAGATIEIIPPSADDRIRALALAIGGSFTLHVVNRGPDQPLYVRSDHYEELLKYVPDTVARPYICHEPFTAIVEAARADIPITLIANAFQQTFGADVILASLSEDEPAWNAWRYAQAPT